MQIDAKAAARALAKQPAPALPLDRFRQLLEPPSGAPPPAEDDLLATLRLRPDLFRILDPWKGSWKALLARKGLETAGYRESFRRWGVTPGRPWVVARPMGSDQQGIEGVGPIIRSLRECVLWLALTVDDESVLALARWTRIAAEERAVRRSWEANARGAAGR